MTTNQTVWVCIATYAPEDDIPALCAVAHTAQEAEEQIYNVIHEHCKDSEVDEGEWVAQEPVECPILPVDTTPRGVEAWLAAGISQADVDAWFADTMDSIDPKDEAHRIAKTMTAADFREEYLADVGGDECLLCGQSLDDHDDDMCPAEDDK